MIDFERLKSKMEEIAPKRAGLIVGELLDMGVSLENPELVKDTIKDMLMESFEGIFDELAPGDEKPKENLISEHYITDAESFKTEPE